MNIATRNTAKIVFTLLCALIAFTQIQAHGLTVGLTVGLALWCAGGLTLATPAPAGYMCERITLLDVVRSDQLIGGLVEESIVQVPELQVFEFFQLDQGITYKTLHRVGLPTTGFRKVNAGVAPSKGRYEQREHNCFLFGGRVEYDKAAGQADSGGAAAIEARESSGTMLSAMQQIGRQIFNGVAINADGFPGLKSFTAFGGDYTYNAGGTTADTASSIYGVIMGEDDTRLIGGAGDVFNLGEFRDESIEDDDGNKLPGRVADLMGWIGLQVSRKFAVVRIANVTADAGKGCTDDLLTEAKELLPSGFTLDHWFMSRRSRKQLRESRQAIANASNGRTVEVPVQDVDGVPIIATDSIPNDDAIEA